MKYNYKNVIPSKISPKLFNAIEKMMVIFNPDLRYYGEFLTTVNMHSDENVPTMGVYFRGMFMNLVYNEKFVDELSEGGLIYVLIHETFHFLFDHPSRLGDRGKELSNVAQDMIINNIIDESFTKDNSGIVHRPKTIEILKLPEEYDGPLVYEDLYYWLLDQKEKYNKNKKSVSGYLQKLFDNMGKRVRVVWDEHFESNIPKELRKEIVDRVKRQLKNRGLVSQSVEQVLNKLKHRKKDYLKEIKKNISSQLMGVVKWKTITRPNRRGINGIKGKRKISQEICVILDTSGSMYGMFEKALSYIFQNDIVINLIQCDAEVKGYQKVYKKSELNSVKIKGLGGTSLMPGVNFMLNDKHLRKLNLLILTDGYTDVLNVTGVNKTLIISNSQECPISGGNVKQIVINENE